MPAHFWMLSTLQCSNLCYVCRTSGLPTVTVYIPHCGCPCVGFGPLVCGALVPAVCAFPLVCACASGLSSPTLRLFVSGRVSGLASARAARFGGVRRASRRCVFPLVCVGGCLVVAGLASVRAWACVLCPTSRPLAPLASARAARVRSCVRTCACPRPSRVRGWVRPLAGGPL